VATELQEERDKCNFDQEEIYNLFYKDPKVRALKARIAKDMDTYPEMANTHKYYEWTPQEIQENWMKKLNKAWEIDRHFYFQ
jgi:hypothetical protein